MIVPHGHWKTTDFIAGLRNSGVVAPFVIDSPVNRTVFESWVETVFILQLRVRHIVVLDNRPSHKGSSARKRIETAGTELRYRPPCRS